MRKPLFKPVLKPLAKQALSSPSAAASLCAGSGLLLGQIVIGIAARQNGSADGLALSLVCLLCGGASVALFLGHLHAERRPRGTVPPMNRWLLTIAAGALASMQLSALL